MTTISREKEEDSISVLGNNIGNENEELNIRTATSGEKTDLLSHAQYQSDEQEIQGISGSKRSYTSLTEHNETIPETDGVVNVPCVDHESQPNDENTSTGLVGEVAMEFKDKSEIVDVVSSIDLIHGPGNSASTNQTVDTTLHTEDVKGELITPTSTTGSDVDIDIRPTNGQTNDHEVLDDIGSTTDINSNIATDTLDVLAKVESFNQPTKQQTIRPVKRARSAYFLFADEKRPEIQKQHPGEGVATIAKSLGQIWSAMSTEEKQPYYEKASLERERVAQEVKAWEEEYGSNPALTKSGDSNNRNDVDDDDMNSTQLLYPAARIRKICKLDPEVRGISKEGLLCITKAAELFTAILGNDCVRVAQIQNRRTLNPFDVVQVCESREKFEFVREDIRDLSRLQQKQNHMNKTMATKTAATNNSKNNTKLDPSNTSRPITSYFASAEPAKKDT